MRRAYQLKEAASLDDTAPPGLDADDGVDVVVKVGQAHRQPLAHQKAAGQRLQPHQRRLHGHLQTPALVLRR